MEKFVKWEKHAKWVLSLTIQIGEVILIMVLLLNKEKIKDFIASLFG